MSVKEIAIWAAQIVTIGGGLTLLYKWFVMPSRKVIKSFSDSSETIKKGLPIFIKLLERWPEPSGHGSFLEDFDEVKFHALTGHALAKSIIYLKDDPSYICEAKTGDCVLASLALCELWGVSHEDMKGRGWLIAIDPVEDRHKTWKVWMKAIQNELPYEATYRIKNHRTGARMSVTTIAVPVKNKNEEVVCYYGIFTEIKPESV